MTDLNCSQVIAHASWPWLLFLVAGAYFWTQKDKKHAQKMIELQVSHDADMKRLLELRDKQVEGLRASYDKELTAIRGAKNLVWIHVTDEEKKRPKTSGRCPTCGGQIGGNLAILRRAH